MHELILYIRQLRHVGAFKVSTRLLLVLLMVIGLWAATTPAKNLPIPSMNDKFIHMMVFFAFAMLADLTTSKRPFWFWKGLPLVTYGALIEILQFYTPNRSFELLDWVADLCGVALYYSMKYMLRKRDEVAVQALNK